MRALLKSLAADSFCVGRHLQVKRPRPGMTFRIQDGLLDAVLYLYKDEADATAGRESGGSGFLFGCAVSGSTDYTLWAVTNRHVVEGGGWTIRVNLKAGGVATIDTTELDWFYHPVADLAVIPIALSQDVHRISFITEEWTLTPEWEQSLEIGPGDPCFTIGRFIGHAGLQRNTPTTRFGQIAQIDSEPIKSDGREQRSYLVEIRSIGGFSGSPVFVYLDAAYYRPWAVGAKTGPDGSIMGVGRFPTGPWLLGVTWCMVPTWEPVCDNTGKVIQQGYKVLANSGLMGVVPARFLAEMFAEGGAAFARRREIEAAIAAKAAIVLPKVIPTSAD